jgi:hypothetical protein
VTAKGKTKKCDMRGDQCQHHEYCDPCEAVHSMSLHGSHCSYGKQEVQAADAHGAALDAPQLCLLE